MQINSESDYSRCKTQNLTLIIAPNNNKLLPQVVLNFFRLLIWIDNNWNKSERVRAGGVTRYLYPLDILGGVVGDLDIDTDGLTMVVKLGRDRDLALCVFHLSNSSVWVCYLLIQWGL